MLRIKEANGELVEGYLMKSVPKNNEAKDHCQ